MCKEKQKEPMVIFKVAFSSLIQPSCRPSPLHIHLNSTNLGLETHHPPKSPSLEDWPLPEGLSLSPSGGLRTQPPWGRRSRAAAQNPRKWSEGTNIGRASPTAGHSAQQPRSFPSHLAAAPLGPRAPRLCHTTCTWHQLFSLKFQIPLLSTCVTPAAITKSPGSTCIPYRAQAEVDPGPAWAGGTWQWRSPTSRAH